MVQRFLRGTVFSRVPSYTANEVVQSDWLGSESADRDRSLAIWVTEAMPACGRSAQRGFRFLGPCLRGALERHDRQMLAPPMVLDIYRESAPCLAGDKRLRPGASRATGPVFARFDARTSHGGSSAEIDFIRCSAAKCRMWAMFVVPSNEGK